MMEYQELKTLWWQHAGSLLGTTDNAKRPSTQRYTYTHQRRVMRWCGLIIGAWIYVRPTYHGSLGMH
jgi:hypothetical protein